MSPLMKSSLFWDTDPEKIDFQKNKRFVIERVLKFGDFSDYNWLKSLYSPKEILDILKRDRSSLDKKSMNFWSIIYKQA